VVACTPHAGLGTVSVPERPALVRRVDLSTCRTSSTHLKVQPSASGAHLVVTRTGATGRQSIVVGARVVYSVRESYRRIPGGTPGPIELFDSVDGGRWILFAIDPMSSQSLAADGLAMRVVSSRGGRVYPVAFGLPEPDYRTWCGGRLVLVAGGDRIATHNKWLVATGPPDWKPRVIAKSPRRAYGSLACAPDGRSIVVESAPASGPNMNVHAHWSLARVGLDGSQRLLTSPPAGLSDESPQVAGDTVYFVRGGRLYALAGRKLLGPLLRLPPTDAYYGHRVWPYGVSR
jgi:hypothetical protein